MRGTPSVSLESISSVEGAWKTGFSALVCHLLWQGQMIILTRPDGDEYPLPVRWRIARDDRDPAILRAGATARCSWIVRAQPAHCQKPLAKPSCIIICTEAPEGAN